ncbi:MAG: hypothetical protein LAO19_18565 [Acidobacteriia bacterium]|nr:hypothetical protein [Terriglobia bacterium]
MRPGFLRSFLAVLVLAGVVAACESAPPPPTFPDIHFTGAPIRLAASAVEVRDDYKPTFQPPHVEHVFPIPPARAAATWARDRLVAAGGNVRAVFRIEEASATETELKKKEEGIAGVFTKEPAQRYDLVLQATLSLVDEHGTPVRTVSVKATRSQSVLEGITPNERDQAWYDMTKALMTDFDQQMTTEISNHFGGYFQ